MNIVSLVIKNAWDKCTSPRILRVSAMAALIILVLTQLLIFLVIIPHLVKIPLTLEQSFAQLITPSGRSAVDLWYLLVITAALFIIKFKTVMIILNALLLAAGVTIIDAFGDEVITQHKVIALGITISLAGAVLVLAAIELLAVYAPLFIKN